MFRVSRTFSRYGARAGRPIPDSTIHAFTSSQRRSKGMYAGQTSSHAPHPVHSQAARANASPGTTWRRRSRSKGPRRSYCRIANTRPRGDALSQPASW